MRRNSEKYLIVIFRIMICDHSIQKKHKNGQNFPVPSLFSTFIMNIAGGGIQWPKSIIQETTNQTIIKVNNWLL